ncbi:sterol carrier family protein [Cutibacterium equinum]|uniref:Sterol carrier family protein n=1 Tax=Cutibacterium equinum TaxID=3016342 RepID=A0ABY7R131_9ACTN|nr:sterol carrier family protein [Cutibacterium equinum]WCC80509.1 sterol carrier family protein [Cutibacterium equinum]
MAARAERGVKRLATTFVTTARSLLPPAQGGTVGPASARLWGRHHIAHIMVILTDTLQTVTTPTTIRPITLAKVIDERHKATGTLATIGHEVIANDTASRLASQAQRLLSEVESVLLASPGPSATVESLVGPVRVTDHLRATLLDMVAMSLYDGVDIPSVALTESCRTLAAVLDESHGGRTIELRVPPACAVQLAATQSGPSHHRGTPPNVAEMDPVTFLQLATGFSHWAEMREAGRLQASGSHVDDVADILPVVNMAEALTEILAED